MSDLSSVLKDISKKYGSGVAKFGADDLTVDGILSLGSPMIDYCLYGGIPEGILTSFVGAPVFLFLIIKGGRRNET